eukprot:SAG31_NODE_23294_length_507_cov_0.767157_1_plen_101_part_10
MKVRLTQSSITHEGVHAAQCIEPCAAALADQVRATGLLRPPHQVRTAPVQTNGVLSFEAFCHRHSNQSRPLTSAAPAVANANNVVENAVLAADGQTAGRPL